MGGRGVTARRRAGVCGSLGGGGRRAAGFCARTHDSKMKYPHPMTPCTQMRLSTCARGGRRRGDSADDALRVSATLGDGPAAAAAGASHAAPPRTCPILNESRIDRAGLVGCSLASRISPSSAPLSPSPPPPRASLVSTGPASLPGVIGVCADAEGGPGAGVRGARLREQRARWGVAHSRATQRVAGVGVWATHVRFRHDEVRDCCDDDPEQAEEDEGRLPPIRSRLQRAANGESQLIRDMRVVLGGEEPRAGAAGAPPHQRRGSRDPEDRPHVESGVDVRQHSPAALLGDERRDAGGDGGEGDGGGEAEDAAGGGHDGEGIVEQVRGGQGDGGDGPAGRQGRGRLRHVSVGICLV